MWGENCVYRTNNVIYDLPNLWPFLPVFYGTLDVKFFFYKLWQKLVEIESEYAVSLNLCLS